MGEAVGDHAREEACSCFNAGVGSGQNVWIGGVPSWGARKGLCACSCFKHLLVAFFDQPETVG